MRNLILYDNKEISDNKWSNFGNFFNDIFLLQTNSTNVTIKEISNFFKERNFNEEDNFYIIWSSLLININEDMDNILLSIDNNNKEDKLCYLINYMEDCKKIKTYNIEDSYTFNNSNNIKNIYAAAASYSFWKKLIKGKDYSSPIHLRLGQVNKENIKFIWPSLFTFSLHTLQEYPYLSTVCKNNIQKNIVISNSTNISFYWFLITVIICSLSYYYYTKKLPKDRFFNIKNYSKKFPIHS